MENRYQKDINKKSRGQSTAKIPWGLMALSFVFLFNPNISVVDILPDFFGYIILSLALLKVSMLSEGLAEARRAFERLILVDGAKLLSMVWIFGVNGSNDRTSSLLLWSFVFGVIEMIFVIPAYVKLFDGFSELGNFHENTAIHGSKRAGGASYTDKLKTFSLFFVVLKAVMCVLPELSALGNTSYDESSAFFNLYRYIGVMRGLCFIPVLVIGGVWLAFVIRYFLRIRADKTLCDSVSAAYSERVMPKRGLFTVRNVRVATWFFVAAMVLTLDVRLEEVNILPDLFIVALLAISFAFFCKTTKLSKPAPVVMMALFGISTLLSDAADKYFHANYSYIAIEKSNAALVAYFVYVGAVALKGILFVSTLAVAFKEIRKVIVEHTGYVLGREINTEGEKERTLEVQNELYKSFTRIVDVAIIYVLSDVLYSLYGAFYAFMDKNLGYLSIINIICGIVFIGMTVKAVDELREAVQTKYMLE